MMPARLAALLLGASACFGAEPIFDPEAIGSWSFRTPGGAVLHDRVLHRRVLGGRTWTVVYSTGLLFTMSANAAGDVEFTWDPIMYLKDDAVPKSFPVFFREPVADKRWNPDGVEIRVERVQVPFDLGARRFTVDEYGFFRDGSELAHAWVAHPEGVLRIWRRYDGEQLVLDRILE
ncbi:MAG TPA: hypothetical protein VM070_01105 [Candidatus Saccharimonadales bacterium]|nr:hypothetical protein [Candidatus Saccharimonadales bacterium]